MDRRAWWATVHKVTKELDSTYKVGDWLRPNVCCKVMA